MAETLIEWCNRVWNFLRGCSMISPGCKYCYAMKQAHRFSGPGGAYEGLTELGPEGPRWTGKIRVVDEKIAEPLSIKRPQRWFVNSMSDLFHDDVPFEAIDRAFAVMALCPQHTFQILTKRPERMREYCDGLTSANGGKRLAVEILTVNEVYVKGLALCGRTSRLYDSLTGDGGACLPLPNVWLGVSAEDQLRADQRIPELLRTPAAVRFVSYEPALGPVDFMYPKTLWRDGPPMCCSGVDCGCRGMPVDPPLFHGIDWVIVGGESGPSARPMHPDWARSVRDQCQVAGVAFFFKQWGEWAPGEHVSDNRRYPVKSYDGTSWTDDCDDWISEEDNGPLLYRVGKKAAGRLLDGREWNEYPASRGGL